MFIKNIPKKQYKTFGGTDGVIRSGQSKKYKQCNGKKGKDKKTNIEYVII